MNYSPRLKKVVWDRKPKRSPQSALYLTKQKPKK